MKAGARSQGGYTLIEVLVSMTVGMIVVLATFGIVDVSLRSNTRVLDRVDSIQRGRIAMELMTQQLRSQVCLGEGIPAIVAAQDNTVTFHADLGDAGFNPEKRRLTFVPGVAGSSGRITEERFAGAGTPPAVTFSASPYYTRTLADGVALVPSTPFLRYFAFTPDPVTPDALLPTGATGLGVVDRARTVKVAVAYRAVPTHKLNKSVEATFENYVYVRTADPTDPERSPLCI